MRFRLGAPALFLLLIWDVASAAPCAQVKTKPGAWVATQVDALVGAAHAAYESDDALPAYERVLDRITGTLRRCGLARDEGFLDRHGRFVEYVEAASLDRQPDHELGFNVPDGQYFEETRDYVRIPEFLLAPGFLRSVSRYETLDRAKSFLRLLNSARAPADQLIFFSYTSRHLGTPDNAHSYRRLLIVVPGDAEEGVPDKWVQFGVPDPGARARIRNVSVVSALAGAGGTFDAYFKDYYRTFRRDGSIGVKGRWELGEGDDNCVRCHKSGVLPIFPVAGSVSAREQEALLEVNRRFLTYGAPRFGKYLDESKFGPGLGSESGGRRGGQPGGGYGETGARRAVSCASCHRHGQLGALNWPMDRIVISSYVKGGLMPFGFELNAPERGELYERLIREYFATDPASPGILKSWLLSKLS
ncbi:MAG: hypothetical protein LC785_13430 [Acidobacteria bacterium]|nr:hypothetical protein [Acidobacteriota bacterium]MCA1642917.1 hypothetical protein [Acidobacteriota bacterium]